MKEMLNNNNGRKQQAPCTEMLLPSQACWLLAGALQGRTQVQRQGFHLQPCEALATLLCHFLQGPARFIRNTGSKPSFSLPQQAVRKESEHRASAAFLGHHRTAELR